ncbi:MAG: LysR family transcriptional regulator [Ideonella sp.]|nr:LysR family transcriptional regulator [Ideonella sp.]MCC7457403.1 LysR family transcriptional regulator [Nitrospira sp.]
MNLRFVEAFYWVVTLESVTRAADKLHLTQSAVSARIAALEAELGTPLVDRRDRKGFRVTVAGRRFFVYAEQLLALQREVKAELGGGAARPVVLRVGAIESVLHSWLMEGVQRLRRAHPALALELTVETSPVLVDQLARGALDVALAALPAAGAGVRTRSLAAMPMVFTGHVQQHRRRGRWSAAELAAHELITFQRGSQPHLALLDWLNRAGVPPLRLHSVSSISAMAQLVEAGLGIATLPLAVVQRLGKRAPLKVLASEPALPPLPVHLSWRDDPASPAHPALVEQLVAAAPLPAPRRSVHRKKR